MEFVCARIRELAAMRDFWLEIFSHHRKKMTKTFKQSPKTKNSKGGKLIRIAFYGKIQCECVKIYIKLFFKIVNKKIKILNFIHQPYILP